MGFFFGTFRADPVIGQVLKERSRSDIGIFIAEFRNVFVAAAIADITGTDRFWSGNDRAFHLDHGRSFFLFTAAESISKERQNFAYITDDAVIAVFENGSIAIFIDGDNGRSVLYSFEVLFGTRYAAGDIQIPCKFLA